MSDAQQVVAFFDFDGTLTRRDTLMPFLKYLSGPARYYSKLLKLSPLLAGYFAKLVRNDLAKQCVLREYLAGMPVIALRAHGQAFNRSLLPSILRKQGMERLRWHKDQGHTCVLVSASLDVYLEDWGHSQGFHDVICSGLEVDDRECVTGNLAGVNCHGAEKVRRVKAWLAENDFLGTAYSYGDSSADIPLLRFVDNGHIWNRRTACFEPVCVLKDG